VHARFAANHQEDRRDPSPYLLTARLRCSTAGGLRWPRAMPKLVKEAETQTKVTQTMRRRTMLAVRAPGAGQC